MGVLAGIAACGEAVVGRFAASGTLSLSFKLGLLALLRLGLRDQREELDELGLHARPQLERMAPLQRDGYAVGVFRVRERLLGRRDRRLLVGSSKLDQA